MAKAPSSYSVNQGDVFGRLGGSIGQALSEQVPKEVERNRLASGLNQFEKESANLSPMQQLAKLSAIPGITPQMIQSFGELGKQQSKANNLIQQSQQNKSEQKEKTNRFPRENLNNQSNETSPSVTTREPVDATINPKIPKTYSQILDRAGELYNQNAGLYGNDPDKAIQAATLEDQQEQNINSALQNQRIGQNTVQDRIKTGLANQRTAHNVDIPENVFSKIEDKAINAVKSKSEGGEGLTEQQAEKKYIKELDSISRKYNAIDDVGTWKLLTKQPFENKRELRSIRNDFKKRDDLENYADRVVTSNNLSPGKGYYMAYPVSDIPKLNNEIMKLPKLTGKTTFVKGYASNEVPEELKREATLKIAPKLVEAMGSEGSPLSIAEELQARNYDPAIWLDYLDRNRKNIKLSGSQDRQLDKPRNFVPTSDDIWMFYLSGLDKLIERE